MLLLTSCVSAQIAGLEFDAKGQIKLLAASSIGASHYEDRARSLSDETLNLK